ncbi:putative tubulin polyglutamylase ttll9 [Blastocladiella emersonii ATCC 22665]|nr:putative tubulin polyglutamylase ttll9 [Blastocladiella emersonii ATCC 22665]
MLQRRNDSNTQGEERQIRFRTSLRNTVCDVMRDRGWKETESETEWDFFWCDIHWLHEFYDGLYLREDQRINHFKNHYELTRKDLLVKNMKRMMKETAKAPARTGGGKDVAARYDLISKSFVLPQEHALFQEEFKRNAGTVWIMKPVGKAQGRGIFLINKISQVNGWRKDPRLMARGENGEPAEGPEAYIVQRYIDRPYLIGGKKFDIRSYALVTSWNPLTVYIHRHAFCRFSNTPFSMDAKDISNMYIHATNVAIQKTAPNYDGSKGCKWLIRNLKLYLASKHGDDAVRTLFNEIEELMIRALVSVQKIMINDKHCFELYGYDILIDQDLRPWLLEINASPSLSAETQWDYDLKYGLLNDVFDVVDMERRFTSGPGGSGGDPPRMRVGGFDCVYRDGPVPHTNASVYESYLGAYHPIKPSPRKFGRKKRPVPPDTTV